ncbi:GNAT family protein, partial [Staphylococcus epidermidis]
LLQINFIHTTSQVLIIIHPQYPNNRYPKKPFKIAIHYPFLVLNINNVYLYLHINNHKPLHIYQTNNFQIQPTLNQHFYTTPEYRHSYL